MGEPATVKPWHLKQGPTRGTETSKYPEEKKTTVIPRVAASESGGAQTVAVKAAAGLKDSECGKHTTGEPPWKGRPESVKAAYPKWFVAVAES